MAELSILERRCRWLLRAYPPDYRAARGEEIVGTLLDATPPGRRWPLLGDAADLTGHGLRRRLGARAVAGVGAGLAVAAPVALALTGGIAGYAWWRVEPVAGAIYSGPTPFIGLFRTLGPVAFACWLVAVVGWLSPRTDVRRLLIGIAIGVTVGLPIVAAMTTVDRPPLWVIMALTVFGLFAFGGAGLASGGTDARLVVPVGALGIAVATSTVSTVVDAGGTYYYQPTIARVGIVVSATVVVLAGIAVLRQIQGRPATSWLWAAALLGLPAGWLGPFQSPATTGAAAVPHFGRLAQVVLATCVAAGTLAWFARRSRPAPATLRVAGAAALGAGVGLGGFVTAGWLVTGTAGGWPAAVTVPVVVLMVVGLTAVAGGRGRARPVVAAAAGGVAAAATAWLVGVYDNGWAVTGWADFGRTARLATTITLIPLSACLHVAARQWLTRSVGWPARGVAAAIVVGCVGWIGYAAVPYLTSWGPMLVALALCWVAAAIPAADRGTTEPEQGRMV